jgi:hypothetical protein
MMGIKVRLKIQSPMDGPFFKSLLLVKFVRVTLAVTITFDVELLCRNCLACPNWKRRAVGTVLFETSRAVIDRPILKTAKYVIFCT